MSNLPATASVATTHAVIIGEWVLVGACVATVAARFHVRKSMMKGIFIDDWLILFALVRQPVLLLAS